MGEQLHSPEPGPIDKEPELEHLADWLIHYELSRGESKQALPALPEAAAEDSQSLPESYFDRRHEVMDDTTRTVRPPKLQPTVPLAKILETRNLPKHPPVPQTPATRLAKVPKTSGGTFRVRLHHYSQAIRKGFLAGLGVLTILFFATILR